MSATISTNLDDAVATKAREIAHREHRSISNLVANAVAVFTDMPKELRDTLLELRAENDDAQLQEFVREMSALAARTQFDLATRRLVAEGPSFAELADADEMDIMAHATDLTRSALRNGG
jgi:hypothetical protein